MFCYDPAYVWNKFTLWHRIIKQNKNCSKVVTIYPALNVGFVLLFLNVIHKNQLYILHKKLIYKYAKQVL